jgi:DNA (cytosine-5)-methyltransferase 1
MTELHVLEVFGGAGGMSLGLEQAGLTHQGVVDVDPRACETLRANRPGWRVLETDVRDFSGHDHRGVDLLAAGVPCLPPIGRVRRGQDSQDLFDEVLRLVREAQPAAVMIETVRFLQSDRFEGYRRSIVRELNDLGYASDCRILNAADYGVPQRRARLVGVGVKQSRMPQFVWPERQARRITVGESLSGLMAANGWQGAETWSSRASRIAPTVSGWPIRPRNDAHSPHYDAWLQLGVDPSGIADSAPGLDDPVTLIPRLTVPMFAKLQGFDDSWHFCGHKVAAYRQIRNAFPPPVTEAVASSIATALGAASAITSKEESHRSTPKTGSNRGSVPAAVLKAIVARDGGECRYPECPQGRLVTQTTNGEWVFTGEIAHIRAVSPGGPRHDPSYTKAMLNATSNLLVLCLQHHAEVDRHNPDRYGVDRLESWLVPSRSRLAEPVVRSLRAC